MIDNTHIDLEPIIKKLERSGKAQRTTTGYAGMFSINHDSHLLSARELEDWIKVLHDGDPHKSSCSDMHQWNFEFIND